MNGTWLLWRSANVSTLKALRRDFRGQYDIRLGKRDEVTEFFSGLPQMPDADGIRIEIPVESVPSGDGGVVSPQTLAARRMSKASARGDWYFPSQGPESAYPLWRPGVGPTAATEPNTDFVLLLRTPDDRFFAGWLRETEIERLPDSVSGLLASRAVGAAELGVEEAGAMLGFLGGSPAETPPSEEVEQGMAEAAEGRQRTVQHVRRERSRWLRRQKIAAAGERPLCEACDFDFEAVYGERGRGFIECHHLIPVSELDPSTPTRLEDLALLCANCHRMVHAARPWLDLPQLRALIGAKPNLP